MSQGLTGQACECPSCGVVFRSVAGFDMHRVGKFRPLERRCLNEVEMVEVGMAPDPKGRWRKPYNFAGAGFRGDGGSKGRVRVEGPQTPELSEVAK